MFFRNKIKKSRGQAMIEYALLLMIAVLASVAYFQLDDSLRIKINLIASDLVEEEPHLPYVVPPIKDNEDLSPPVADFTVPSPNYKGRDIHLVNRSFDTDGVIDNYIWTVDGREIRQGRFDAEKEEGLVVNFRYSGTYTVSLVVIDNDGLVSNKVTKTVYVENRSPAINLSAVSHLGGVASNGGTITVYQYCSAQFNTMYEDKDLPYEVLTLYSRFSDSTGVVSQYDTIPFEFTRVFENEGRNEYYVRVTDEDGASVSSSVYINVVENPDPAAMASKTCTAPTPPQPRKPQFQIQVTGYYDKDESKSPREYYFRPNTKATVRGVVQFGDYPEHTYGRYWTTTDNENSNNTWDKKSDAEMIQRPINTTFTPSTEPITITGMARDTSARSNTPNPSLAGMSNKDSVVLKVLCDPSLPECVTEPTAVLSVNKKTSTDTPPEEQILELSVGAVDPSTNFNCDEDKCTLTINSSHSYSNSGGTIEGVRFKFKGTWYPKNTNAADNFGMSNIVSLKDHKGKTELWFSGSPNSPDTNKSNGMDFKIGRGYDTTPLKDKWTYELRVIDSNGISSTESAKKTIWLKTAPPAPKVYCKDKDKNDSSVSGTTTTNVAKLVNARGSKDGEGNPIKVRWKAEDQDGGRWTSYIDANNSPSKTWKYDKAGTYKITVQGKDSYGQVDSATCTVTITAPRPDPAITVEWYSIANRAAMKGEYIEAKNVSTPATNVGDNVWWHWSMDSSASESSGSGWKEAGKNTTARIAGTNNVQGAINFWINVTDKDGKPTCANTPSAQTIAKDSQKKYCVKSTVYWRMDYESILKLNQYSHRYERCKIATIRSTGFNSIDRYENEWPWLKNEYSAGVNVLDQIKGFLTPKNCTPIS